MYRYLYLYIYIRDLTCCRFSPFPSPSLVRRPPRAGDTATPSAPLGEGTDTERKPRGTDTPLAGERAPPPVLIPVGGFAGERAPSATPPPVLVLILAGRPAPPPVLIPLGGSLGERARGAPPPLMLVLIPVGGLGERAPSGAATPPVLI